MFVNANWFGQVVCCKQMALDDLILEAVVLWTLRAAIVYLVRFPCCDMCCREWRAFYFWTYRLSLLPGRWSDSRTDSGRDFFADDSRTHWYWPDGWPTAGHARTTRTGNKKISHTIINGHANIMWELLLYIIWFNKLFKCNQLF